MLDHETILEFKNVSKKFTYSLRAARKYGMKRLLRGSIGFGSDDSILKPDEFWALKDASFTLKKGEALGLIGSNGAGKSTILKMINGLFLPDVGEIQMRGKVGALIELGTGFHPYLSGRENIIVKGALMGKSKEEINELFVEIVEFSELGDFIDSPVKNYSSGMFVRLGFSVAVHIDPDILLMDEILAVGDFRFKMKCLEKINAIKGRMSIILISHNMNDITRFCDRAIVLDKGETTYEGKPKVAVKHYLEQVESKDSQKSELESENNEQYRYFQGDLFHNKDKIVDIKHQWVDSNGKKLGSINRNDKIILEFSFRLLVKVKSLIIGVPIWDQNGNLITALNSDMDNSSINISENGLVKGCVIVDKIILNPGVYHSVMAIIDGREFIYRDLLDTFSIKQMIKSFGFVNIEGRWKNR